MKDSRLAIQEYIDQNFKGYELTHDSSITIATEPRLKYNRIDRYSVKVITPKALGLFIDFINQCKHVELYFAFGYLCIGYQDREYGETMRLDAFTNSHKDDQLRSKGLEQGSDDGLEPVLFRSFRYGQCDGVGVHE